MSPQTVPTAPPLEQIPANLEKAAASNPVAPTIPFQPNLGNLPLADSQPAQESAPISKKSPQSSPKRFKLTHAEMHALAAVLEYLQDDARDYEQQTAPSLNHIGRHVLKLTALFR